MYKFILKDTLETIQKLPVVIPERGLIAGFSLDYIPPINHFFENDNWHYPMGTAFIKYGLSGIIELAHKNKEKVKNEYSFELLDGIEKTYSELIKYLAKYVKKLGELFKSDPQDRYVQMKESIERLMVGKPKTFLDGMQLYYFMWKIRGCATLNGDLGRLDKHLYHLYESDIQSGLAEEDILQVIVDFYEMLNKSNSGDTLCNITLGGLNEDGTDSSTRLSYLFLKANTIVKKTEPHLNVRVNSKMRKDVYDEMIEVQYLGQGQANSYFEDTIIPALLEKGLPKEAVYNFTNDGCTEITFDGCSGIDFSHIDIVACLECAMDRGKRITKSYFKPVKYFHKDCPEIMYTPDIVYGYDSGDMENSKSFDELYNYFIKQYKYQINQKADALKNLYLDRKNNKVASLFLQGTYERVLESGIDIMKGGFLVENYQMFSGSIPTVADELIAIKHAVFIDKIATIREIREAIDVNYVGYEPLRQKLLSYPKFGNDIDEVDYLSADIANVFADTIEEYSLKNDFLILPDLLGWRFLEEAYGTAAGFDGRKYSDQIAEHYCATPGKAKCGPTALINSIGKTNLRRFVGVAAMHLTLPRRLADTKEESLQILKTLNQIMNKKGFIMMALAIYDTDRLIQAQIHPEDNQDVIIRVWGYSAKFVDLCKEMQDHIISRTITMGE